MIDLRDLQVKPGQPVWPAWRKLLEWAKQFRIISGNGIRLTRTAQGTYVIADVGAASYPHPFKVSLGANEVRVSLGTVEDVVPVIGKVALDAEPQPVLQVTGKPNSDGVSWVALVVENQGEQLQNAAIKHVTTLERPDDKTGVQALAMLRWTGGQPTQSFQIVHHSLGHHYVKPTETRGSRHLFWAK